MYTGAQWLYSGFRNWVAKIGKLSYFRCSYFQERPQNTEITTINMYIEVKKLIYKCVLRSDFWGFGCPNDTKKALLAYMLEYSCIPTSPFK